MAHSWLSFWFHLLAFFCLGKRCLRESSVLRRNFNLLSSTSIWKCAMISSTLFTQICHLRCCFWRETVHSDSGGRYSGQTSSSRQTPCARCLVRMMVFPFACLASLPSRGRGRRPCRRVRLRPAQRGSTPDCWTEMSSPTVAWSHWCRDLLGSKSRHQAYRRLGIQPLSSTESARWRSPTPCLFLSCFSLTCWGKQHPG